MKVLKEQWREQDSNYLTTCKCCHNNGAKIKINEILSEKLKSIKSLFNQFNLIDKEADRST